MFENEWSQPKLLTSWREPGAHVLASIAYSNQNCLSIALEIFRKHKKKTTYKLCHFAPSVTPVKSEAPTRQPPPSSARRKSRSQLFRSFSQKCAAKRNVLHCIKYIGWEVFMQVWKWEGCSATGFISRKKLLICRHISLELDSVKLEGYGKPKCMCPGLWRDSLPGPNDQVFSSKTEKKSLEV